MTNLVLEGKVCAHHTCQLHQPFRCREVQYR